MTVVLVYLVAGGAGAFLTSRILDSKLNPALAFLAAGLGGLCTIIPFGRYVAFFVSVVLFRQFSPRGDWQDALFTAIGSNALVLIVLLMVRTGGA
jgi:hypothetical protein